MLSLKLADSFNVPLTHACKLLLFLKQGLYFLRSLLMPLCQALLVDCCAIDLVFEWEAAAIFRPEIGNLLIEICDYRILGVLYS